jgi:branched-chain amino acid transport system ATP-binding protein
VTRALSRPTLAPVEAVVAAAVPQARIKLLEVDNLHGGYGEIEILHGFSIQVAEGEAVGLIGPNGHGKTTLLRTISGLQRPRSGAIRFKGTNVFAAEPRSLVQQGLVHVPQGNAFFPRLTVLENLLLGAYHRRAWTARAESLAKVFRLFPPLKARSSQRCRTLSGGERQMLGIGMGLMARPLLLMLDEPTLGLAPRIRRELVEAIAGLLDETTLLIVDQDLDFILSLTSRQYVVNQGRVSFETSGDQLARDRRLLESYFGTSSER